MAGGTVVVATCSNGDVDESSIKAQVTLSPETAPGGPEKELLDAICSKAVALASLSEPGEISVSYLF